MRINIYYMKSIFVCCHEMFYTLYKQNDRSIECAVPFLISQVICGQLCDGKRKTANANKSFRIRHDSHLFIQGLIYTFPNGFLHSWINFQDFFPVFFKFFTILLLFFYYILLYFTTIALFFIVYNHLNFSLFTKFRINTKL